MTRTRSAIVHRSSPLNGGGWCAIIIEDGRKQFVNVDQSYPQGTRLVMRDGQWVKPADSWFKPPA